MHDFVRDLIALRKQLRYAWSPESWDSPMDLNWLAPDGSVAGEETWGGRAIQMHYTNASGAEHPEVLVLMNMYDGVVNYTLPAGRNWARVVDTQSYFDLPGAKSEPTGWFDENLSADAFASANITLDMPAVMPGEYGVQPRSIVVMVQQAGR
jgi:glycogen operon protein